MTDSEILNWLNENYLSILAGPKGWVVMSTDYGWEQGDDEFEQYLDVAVGDEDWSPDLRTAVARYMVQEGLVPGDATEASAQDLTDSAIARCFREAGGDEFVGFNGIASCVESDDDVMDRAIEYAIRSKFQADLT